MSAELRRRLAERLERLQSNLAGMQRILTRSTAGVPDQSDLPGIAWLLMSSYSDFEEVLKFIATEWDGPLPASGSWHRSLLDQLSSSTASRAGVISQELKADLDAYLSFRHFACYSTYAVLQWERMRPMVDGLPRVVAAFQSEIERFVAGGRRA